MREALMSLRLVFASEYNSLMKVRTRMAPSPTGELHVGGLRTALYDFAWAKKHDGQFVLRIEDTDRERQVIGATERLLEVFRDYGLSWDEGPFLQSERLPIYQKYAEELVTKGHAYYCTCTKQRLEQLRKAQQETGQLPRYDRHCRELGLKKTEEPYVIRLKVPDNEEIVFVDVVRGEIKTNSSTIDDQVLLKSDGFPTYHLAVVVDDYLMEITHVIRANEWISSTPKHVLLYKFLGWELPQFIHLSIFLDPEGDGKMSKRKGAVSARSFLEAGYLPEAMLNYLMLLGWNPGTERELFTLSEFIEAFDLKDLNKSNQKFTFEKLNWFNQQYIRALDDVTLAQRLKDFTKQNEVEIAKTLPLVKERMVTLKDFDQLTEYFWQLPKAKVENKAFLEHAIVVLEKNWDGKVLEEKAREFCAENNIRVGDYFMTLRVAITGKTTTPPLWEVMEVLGKKETIGRLKQ